MKYHFLPHLWALWAECSPQFAGWFFIFEVNQASSAESLSLPCSCLDHQAALPWPYGSSIDYRSYFFTQKHNASKRPNCPWRAKIIVYNRPSTCHHKSATVFFRVRTRARALYSGNFLSRRKWSRSGDFKHVRAMWRGGTALFQEMRQCPFGEEQHSSRHLRNNGIHYRDAAHEVCLWVRSDNGGQCYTTQETGLAWRGMRRTSQTSLTFTDN